ncbi:hypothetical protein EVJ58_g9021 [Rhodofomes roseus]|uniref:Uncharacterized protein n=1 Tax=Rhodofomes roseus TaxID=34475 RepID=A0A4Y9XWJ2_9APHY|nr:hypothetical protein EVJ58_g9021 [Rhodofomes roseus]
MSEEEKRTLAAQKEEEAETNPSDAEHSDDEASAGDVGEDTEQAQSDSRLSASPSPWQRLALVTFVLLMFWFAWAFRKHNSRPNIVYADRYSAEYKYRPAASPIITEILKDGRTRLRGAVPTNK